MAPAAGHNGVWSLCPGLSHFQQWHGLDPRRQIYNVDKSLYTNNLQSFSTLFCQIVNAEGGEGETAVQSGSTHFSL